MGCEVYPDIKGEKMMKRGRIRRYSFLLLAVLFLAAVAGCSKDVRNPVATITLESGHQIVIKLYYNKAPNTVTNFVYLAQSGFYDGLTFHRVVEDFVVQGGDPNGDGTGNPGYYIKGEFPNNGYEKNDIKHVRGVVSMARRGSSDKPEDYYDTAGCQFFIMLEEKSSLDGDYAAFGYVQSGMEYVDEIGEVSVDENDKPREDVVIKSITVETYGQDFGKPNTIELPEDES